MIKSLAYFPLQCARNSGPVISALLSSAGQRGIKICENDLDCDAALIWSVLWSGRMLKNEEIYHRYRAAGKSVIISEVGTLRRGITWKIAVNNITADGHYGNQQDLDPDRPAKLQLSLKSAVAKPSILIALQHRNSLQVQDQPELMHWLQNHIRLIRQHTDRPMIVRPHPRDKVDLSWLPKDIEVWSPKHRPGTYDEFDLCLDHHAVVNHNSGVGTLSALAGSRPVVHRSSLAYPMSINIQDIEKPYDIDRAGWLIEISHTEYTVEEIQQGLWLKRLANWLL